MVLHLLFPRPGSLLTENKIDLAHYFSGCPGAQRECVLKLVSGVKRDEALPRGREQKRFLFDIVANARNGVDVDKVVLSHE